MIRKKEIYVDGYFILVPKAKLNKSWKLTRSDGIINWKKIKILFNPALTDQQEVITLQLDASTNWFFVDPALVDFPPSTQPWTNGCKTLNNIQVKTNDPVLQEIIDNTSAQAGIFTEDKDPPSAALISEDQQKSKTMTLTFSQPAAGRRWITVDLQFIAYEVIEDNDGTTIYNAYMSSDPTFKKRTT